MLTCERFQLICDVTCSILNFNNKTKYFVLRQYDNLEIAKRLYEDCIKMA